jgi:hypothetical protein
MMDSRWVALGVVILILAFALGFSKSYVSGIQPGYFEKQEAPAYGVGGGDGLGADLSKDMEEHYKSLYQEDEE